MRPLPYDHPGTPVLTSPMAFLGWVGRRQWRTPVSSTHLAEDEGVVAVEDDDPGGLTGQGRQQLGGRVDLGEPVELVAGHVEQQRVGRRDEFGELQSVPLLSLIHI